MHDALQNLNMEQAFWEVNFQRGQYWSGLEQLFEKDDKNFV